MACGGFRAPDSGLCLGYFVLLILLIAKDIFCRADERSVIRRMNTHTADNATLIRPTTRVGSCLGRLPRGTVQIGKVANILGTLFALRVMWATAQSDFTGSMTIAK